MTKQKFDQFWAKGFLPKADKIADKYPNISFDASKQDLIYNEYQALNQRLHNYMVDPAGRIDRHKIGSTLVSVILKVLPFSGVSPQQAYDLRFSKLEHMPNETWAWHCALSIIFSFRMQMAQQNADQETINLLGNGFDYPPCSHGEYEEHVLRSLYHARKSGLFDVFSFSHVLFFVEEYTLAAKKSAALGP